MSTKLLSITDFAPTCSLPPSRPGRRRRTGGWRQWLTFRQPQLLSLAAATHNLVIEHAYHAGLQTVAIAQIGGSENRAHDFDADFMPLHEHLWPRWQSVARAWQGGKLPPVHLIQITPFYFVRDGHHRISVAKANGQDYIEALVTVWQIQPQVDIGSSLFCSAAP